MTVTKVGWCNGLQGGEGGGRLLRRYSSSFGRFNPAGYSRLIRHWRPRGVLRIPKLARSLRNTVARNHDPTQTWSNDRRRVSSGIAIEARSRAAGKSPLRNVGFPQCWTGGRFAEISPPQKTCNRHIFPKWENYNMAT